MEALPQCESKSDIDSPIHAPKADENDLEMIKEGVKTERITVIIRNERHKPRTVPTSYSISSSLDSYLVTICCGCS